MTSGSSVRSIAACFGFAAFAVAIVSGLWADRSLPQILTGAIASLMVCFVLGVVIGVIAERAIDEAANHYRAVPSGDAPELQTTTQTEPHAEGNPA